MSQGRPATGEPPCQADGGSSIGQRPPVQFAACPAAARCRRLRALSCSHAEREVNYTALPRVTCTSPAIASAGHTEAQLVPFWAPYLTMSEALRLAVQSFRHDVTKPSCCAALPARHASRTEEPIMTLPEEADWIGSARRQAALPLPLRDLHRAVLRRFLDTGAAPTLDWVRQTAGELGVGDSAVAELEAADLVHSDGGMVTVAYPFSGMPTRQQVKLDGFPAVYVMCAIDALGIPARSR